MQKSRGTAADDNRPVWPAEPSPSKRRVCKQTVPPLTHTFVQSYTHTHTQTKPGTITMEAQKVYIKIMRLALKSTSNLSRRRIEELNSSLGELRQLLSCVVCCQLLMDPYKPNGRRCGHHVCRLCLRGRKRLQPSCSECQDCFDFKTYEENKSMALQLLCYKTMCAHLMQSSLFVQLAGERPDIFNDNYVPRIKLPDKSTQWFIQEGANYDDMCDTFLSQPDLPFPKNMPLSLPAETPPTTAATTPELPYEQHMPEQLSITDIELEAAATAEQGHFSHPLPMMAAGARMLSHSHIAPQPQQMIIPAGYIADPTWSEQVELSGAFSNYTTYVVPSGSELHMPTIGQVVQIPQQEMVQATLEPTALTEVPTSKRRHDEMLAEEMEQDAVAEQEPEAPPIRQASISMTRLDQKPTIISSVQVKPPSVAAIVTKPVEAAIDVQPQPTVTVDVATSKSTKAAESPERDLKIKETSKRRFCRCGTSAAPGPTTCRKGRCVCYTAGYSCVGCKCVGCNNPHKYTGESSDGEDEMDDSLSEQVKPQPTSSVAREPAEAALASPVPAEPEAAAMQSTYTLVPLDNLQQSQLPLVIVQNERGEYQCMYDATLFKTRNT